jgi:5-methyltetrahydrofolate--homocysteine methyltransferase
MRESIVDVLKRGGLVISDGALGTMLHAKGLPGGVMPEAWNLENPEAVRQVHRAYVEAGAQSITANTFGGNRFRLRDGGLADRLVEVNQRGIALAREVVGDGAWVAASIGPTGHLMDPLGDLTVADAEALYGEQITAVAEAGADLILLETHHDIEEICCAIRMAKAHTNLPVFCSFAFNAKGRTMMGLRPDAAARRVREEGGDAVGANCGDGPAAILAALEKMRDATDLPLIAQSNAGIPQVGAAHETIWDVTPTQMATHALAFVSLGARFVGGCCGANPAHIAAIVAALNNRS